MGDALAEVGCPRCCKDLEHSAEPVAVGVPCASAASLPPNACEIDMTLAEFRDCDFPGDFAEDTCCGCGAARPGRSGHSNRRLCFPRGQASLFGLVALRSDGRGETLSMPLAVRCCPVCVVASVLFNHDHPPDTAAGFAAKIMVASSIQSSRPFYSMSGSGGVRSIGNLRGCGLSRGFCTVSLAWLRAGVRLTPDDTG